jgi:hypothetical protein
MLPATPSLRLASAHLDQLHHPAPPGSGRDGSGGGTTPRRPQVPGMTEAPATPHSVSTYGVSRRFKVPGTLVFPWFSLALLDVPGTNGVKLRRARENACGVSALTC